MKTCVRCGVPKEDDAFYRRTDTQKPDNTCKACKNARDQQRRAALRAGTYVNQTRVAPPTPTGEEKVCIDCGPRDRCHFRTYTSVKGGKAYTLQANRCRACEARNVARRYRRKTLFDPDQFGRDITDSYNL
jgi:hypothetical protein